VTRQYDISRMKSVVAIAIDAESGKFSADDFSDVSANDARNRSECQYAVSARIREFEHARIHCRTCVRARSRAATHERDSPHVERNDIVATSTLENFVALDRRVGDAGSN